MTWPSGRNQYAISTQSRGNHEALNDTRLGEQSRGNQDAISTQSRGNHKALNDTRLGEQQPSEERERPIDDRRPGGRGPPDGTRGEMMADPKHLFAYESEHEGHKGIAFAVQMEWL